MVQKLQPKVVQESQDLTLVITVISAVFEFVALHIRITKLFSRASQFSESLHPNLSKKHSKS